MNKPLFSVIIPTYNRAHTLERAVSSVFKQTIQDYELIIVDDGSTDVTQDHLQKLIKYKPNQVFVKLLKNKENKGVSAARNYGTTYANGSWFAFLDSDDEWLEHKLETQKKFIEEHSDCRIVHGEEIWIRNGVRVNQKKIHKKSGGNIFERCTELCLISPSAVAIEKSLYEQEGGFREDFPVCEDYDLWLKITSAHEIGYIEEPIINKYGGHEDQLSRKLKAMDYYRVLSLLWVLENKPLDSSMRAKALEVALTKCEILKSGFRKHEKFEKLEETNQLEKKLLSL